MASDAVIDRIVNLLRLAADRVGTPEGDNAAAHARRLMERHGTQVILGDIPPEEQPRAREVGADFGTFDSREAWLEQIAHVVGWLYDVAPVWYWTENGRVGLAVFDVYGDTERLESAKTIFDQLVRIIVWSPMPKRMLHNVEPRRAESIFRAGVSHALATRLSRIGQVPRDEQPDLPSNDEVVALVPVRVHRRPRHANVDPAMDVPVQGSDADWAEGAEAMLFHYGMNAGQRAFLPVTEEESVRR
jgi:hypothetical protein